MYPKSFAYVRAESVAHAVDLLREYGDDARLLAGGASLIPLMKLRLANPELVIDLAGVPGLRATRRVTGRRCCWPSTGWSRSSVRLARARSRPATCSWTRTPPPSAPTRC